ncbi:MAG: Na+ dependent nucleoside transporter N-terminal domain-containing protein, partial [Candidatus Sericytochromatia bacterium]
MERLLSLFGLFVIIGIAYALSSHRKAISWRIVITGLVLQFVFAVLILKTGPGQFVFKWTGDRVTELLGFTQVGSSFIFGSLVQNIQGFGFIFAFQVLPTIIFVSSIMAVLYHLGVMQLIVNVIAKVMVKTMGTSGAESLSAAANIFVGQTEAPLLIKPYVTDMTRSELMAIMT